MLIIGITGSTSQWIFNLSYHRTKEGWEPVRSDEEPRVQFVAYGSPLTEAQFQKLAENVSIDEYMGKAWK
jgi:hypothetical protein